MTVTFTEAVDLIFGIFNTAWTGGAEAIVGSVPTVHWQGMELPDKPDPDTFWCIAQLNTVQEKQATLRGGNDPIQAKRYTTTGIFTLQLYCPRSDSQAMDLGRQLAVLARNAFRKPENGNNVWFRNPRINELPPDENSYRLNVIVEYEFDDIG